MSDFLEPRHFFEPIHVAIFETAAALIRAGKVATPVTQKTFLPADFDAGGLTAPQYLARLAAEATTIINAEDYGRTIYDLSVRRDLIQIGEEIVNEAYEAPIDRHTAGADRGSGEAALRAGRNRPLRWRFHALQRRAEGSRRHGEPRLPARRPPFRHRLGPRRPRPDDGGLQPSDLIILAGRPAMGKTSLATNIAFNVAAAYTSETLPDGSIRAVDGGVVGFFLAGNVGGAARHPYSRRAGRDRLLQDPTRRHFRARIRQARQLRPDDADDPALYRRHRRHLHAQLRARARR